MTDVQRQIDTRALEIAAAAAQAISSHEKVCSERQSQIIQKFDDSKDDRDAFRRDMTSELRSIRNVIAKSALSLIAGLFAAVAWFLSQHGLPGVH